MDTLLKHPGHYTMAAVLLGDASSRCRDTAGLRGSVGVGMGFRTRVALHSACAMVRVPRMPSKTSTNCPKTKKIKAIEPDKDCSWRHKLSKFQLWDQDLSNNRSGFCPNWLEVLGSSMACAVRILKGSTAKALAYIKASRCEAVAFIVHVMGPPRPCTIRWTYQKLSAFRVSSMPSTWFHFVQTRAKIAHWGFLGLRNWSLSLSFHLFHRF